MVVGTRVGNYLLRIVRDLHAAYRVGKGFVQGSSHATVLKMAFMFGMAVMFFMTGWRVREGWFVHERTGQPNKIKTDSRG
jgi:hypothetical protein